MSIQPIRDQIAVVLITERKQEGLIIRPSTIEEKFVNGMVYAVGSGRVTMNGAIVPLDVKLGDEVKFNKSMATEVTHKGDTYYVLREDAVTCILR